MFNWGMVVWAVLLISCKNTGATTSDGATDSTQVTSVEQILKLPALKPGEEIVFEDDKVRIVEGGIVNTDGGMYNTLNMQPKNASYKQFKIEGTVLAFENVGWQCNTGQRRHGNHTHAVGIRSDYRRKVARSRIVCRLWNRNRKRSSILFLSIRRRFASSLLERRKGRVGES